ncbi:MAG: hypothetical protein ACTSVI_08255 [Promethearchaeota archaeon]
MISSDAALYYDKGMGREVYKKSMSEEKERMKEWEGGSDDGGSDAEII